MCSGTIGMPLTGTETLSMLDCGLFVRITRVVALGAVTEAKSLTSEPLAVAAVELCMIRLSVQAASAAVIGVPSLHLSPLRIVNVQVSLSDEVVQDEAR
jgi:hypothetical protein